MALTKTAGELIDAAGELRDQVDRLAFGPPVTHVHNPLDYAWAGHARYLEKYGRSGAKVVFVGMNPGPWGMAQTGVPFGEVAMVRDWLGIDPAVRQPDRPHPKRPIEGLGCKRSEVSGRRLWGLFAQRFPTPGAFFADHFVANYCPLMFMEQSGRNRTPDKLPIGEREPLEAACDRHLARVLAALGPKLVVGIGVYAQRRARRVAEPMGVPTARILHPSPASPKANRGWAQRATAELRALGVWA